MESTGLLRKTDDLGRVVLPTSLRQTLGISLGDSLEIFIRDGSRGGEIVMSRYQAGCWLCGAVDDLAEPYLGRRVCRRCEAAMAAAASQSPSPRTQPKAPASPARKGPEAASPSPSLVPPPGPPRAPAGVQPLDKLGRLVLPKAVRQALRIDFGEGLLVMVRPGGEIVLARDEPVCIFCGADGEGLVEVLGRHVCRQCGAGIVDAAAAASEG